MNWTPTGKNSNWLTAKRRRDGEPILNHEGMPKLDTPQKRVVTAMLLENTEKEAFRANEIQRGGWGLLTEDASHERHGGDSKLRSRLDLDGAPNGA